MIHKLLDRFLKDIIERYAQEIIGAVLSQSAFRVLSTQLDKEIIVRSQEVDKAILIRTRQGKHIIHFEFYKRYTRKHLRDTFSYAGVLTAKYNLDVTTIWLLAKPPSKRAKDIGLYQTMPFGAPTNQFSFIVVKLWEWYDAIFAGTPALMPLVPMLSELVVKPNLNHLRRQCELISLERDAKRRAEMLLYSVAFGKRHFPSRVVDKIFANLLQENLKMIKEFKAVAETPVIKEVIQEEVAKQVQEQVEKQVQERVGKQVQEVQERVEKQVQRRVAKQVQEVQEQVKKQLEQQKRLALQEALLDVLAIRFGKENGKVRRLVLAVNNPQKLKAMHHRALKAKSIDPIIALLQKA